MGRTHIDTSDFLRRMSRLQNLTPQVRDAAIKQTVRHGLLWILSKAPRDTNRYVRGIAQAGNAAQAGPLPVLTIRDSSRQDRYIAILAGQYEAWAAHAKSRRARLRFLYPKGPPSGRRGGRRGSLYYKLQREIEKADKLARRAKEELDKATRNEGVLLVGFLSGRAQRGRSLATVRHKVYGGTGRFVSSQSSAHCELRVLEPHAQFLERRLRLFARATDVMRVFGIGKLRSDLRTLAQRSGFVVSN